MVDYGGMVNQQALKNAIGFGTRVNPIGKKQSIKNEIQRGLEIRELQQFVQRYKWTGLPRGLDSQLIERILYYRGRLTIFKLGDKFYSLPFALNGGIDVYGRYMNITPLSFNGSIRTDDDGGKHMSDGVFIPDLLLKPLYDELDIGETKDEFSAVILNDYTQGQSEFIVPRYILNQVYHSELSNILVLIKHNLISSAKIYGLRVNNEGEKEAVYEEVGDLEDSIITQGKRIFTITTQQKIDELFKPTSLDTQEYFQAYVSMDNLRENLIGIENNGIFKKKERQLRGEMEMEAGSADLVYQDGLENRQKVCIRLNELFGLDMWVEESERISGLDVNDDGDIGGIDSGENVDGSME